MSFEEERDDIFAWYRQKLEEHFGFSKVNYQRKNLESFKSFLPNLSEFNRRASELHEKYQGYSEKILEKDCPYLSFEEEYTALWVWYGQKIHEYLEESEKEKPGVLDGWANYNFRKNKPEFNRRLQAIKEKYE